MKHPTINQHGSKVKANRAWASRVSSSFILPPSAFSLIELLIAMSILVVLMSMLFVAGRSLLSSNKKASTKTTLASLQGMLAEYDAKTRLSRPPAVWLWWDGGATVPMTSAILDSQMPPESPLRRYSAFWELPYALNNTAYSLDAPGFVGDDSPGSDAFNVRNGSRQVVNTQLAMLKLLSLPANRAALEKLPPKRYMVPVMVGGQMPAPIQVPGTPLYTQYVGSPMSAEYVYYMTGSKAVLNGSRYVWDSDPSQALTPPASGSPPSDPPWHPDLGPAVPVILDDWNNPIIYVPATGMVVRKLNGAKDYSFSGTLKAGDIEIVVSPEGKVDYITNPTQPKLITPGRPFWASAGPDGDFAKGDDNIYSFEP